MAQAVRIIKADTVKAEAAVRAGAEEIKIVVRSEAATMAAVAMTADPAVAAMTVAPLVVAAVPLAIWMTKFRSNGVPG